LLLTHALASTLVSTLTTIAADGPVVPLTAMIASVRVSRTGVVNANVAAIGTLAARASPS
jgi:hypothetical protein